MRSECVQFNVGSAPALFAHFRVLLCLRMVLEMVQLVFDAHP